MVLQCSLPKGSRKKEDFLVDRTLTGREGGGRPGSIKDSETKNVATQLEGGKVF